MPLRALAPLRGLLTGTLLGLNTLAVALSMVPPALLKLVLPFAPVRRASTRLLDALASGWVGFNNRWVVGRAGDAWDVQGLDGLRPRGWYLVCSNHRSWVDILVLQRVFHGRIPFLKFFLKRELIWVPVIGLAWWALDFPFMKRGRGQSAQSADLRATRVACEKFRQLPTTVINFVEGTRFTAAKRSAQSSPYRHLLKPRTGGLGVALATMGDQFDGLLDVTLVYPDGTPSFWQLLCGRAGPVIVRVQERAIPPALVGGDVMADKRVRVQIARWVEAQWQAKDALIEELLASARLRTDAS